MNGDSPNIPKELVSIYRGWFDDPSGRRRYVDIPRHLGIAQFREGVWLDAEWNYARASTSLNWIPPTRFVMVTKLDVPADRLDLESNCEHP